MRKRNYSKYGAIRTNGHASRKEARRAEELKLLERAGIITDLREQVPFVLCETKREKGTIGPRGGRKPGRVIEHGVTYVADFTYFDEHGNYVVEDSKGVRTEAYKIKRKWMLDKYNIRIRET